MDLHRTHVRVVLHIPNKVAIIPQHKLMVTT